MTFFSYLSRYAPRVCLGGKSFTFQRLREEPTMKLRKIALSILASFAMVTGILIPANADVQFETATCDLTLASSYTADATGRVQVIIPDSALNCPFPTSPSTTEFSVNLVNSDGSEILNFAPKTNNKYDAASNKIVTTHVYELLGSIAVSPTTFTQVDSYNPSESAGSFYLDDSGKHYRIRLTQSFTVVRKDAESQPCTVTLQKAYGFGWQDYTDIVVPDSAIKCDGFTFSSSEYDVRLALVSEKQSTAELYTKQILTYDTKTKSYVTSFRLVLTAYQNDVYKQSSAESSYVTKRNQPVAPAPAISNLTFAKSVSIKRATDVNVKVKRTSSRSLRLSITADRNDWYQNGSTPTQKRQTVIPSAKEDLAIIKRGSKVIKRVRLSKYGQATVSIPDIAGNNNYSVTLVETERNIEGKATFKK